MRDVCLTLLLVVILNLSVTVGYVNHKVNLGLFFTRCASLILDDPIDITDYGNMLIPDADRPWHDCTLGSGCYGDQGVVESHLRS